LVKSINRAVSGEMIQGVTVRYPAGAALSR
jgi:hypothetical protein